MKFVLPTVRTAVFSLRSRAFRVPVLTPNKVDKSGTEIREPFVLSIAETTSP